MEKPFPSMLAALFTRKPIASVSQAASILTVQALSPSGHFTWATPVVSSVSSNGQITEKIRSADAWQTAGINPIGIINIVLCALLLLPLAGMAQWYQTGDNSTSGKILISGAATSEDYDDIAISRNKANAGITILNESVTGRSVILFGEAFGGKYGFLAHHSQSFNAGVGFSQTYMPASTVLVGSDVNGLGIISQSDIRFNAGGDGDAKRRMVIYSNGEVNIDQKLWVNNSAIVSANFSDTDPNSSWNTSFSVRNNNGAVNTYSRLTFVSESGGFGAISVKKTDVYKGDMYFQLRNGAGFYHTALLIKADGNLGVGTLNPDQKLTVKGTIHAEEVKVDLNVPAPDYVFGKDYNLMPLDDLEDYIVANKHLPEIPAADEMKTNGLNLKEMNLLLLKKIEELTLHSIQQKKLLDGYDAEIKSLSQRITLLEKNK